ncbi:Inner membrane amino-acid ABC transporter permease protein yecS [Brucella intermedia]|nr:Inner membrane amino-acid ABC transporter permease protein yecS [Brucella intermedia]
MYNFNFAPVFASMDKLLVGAWQTIELSCAAMVLGLIVSIICAVGKTSGPKPVRFVIDAYIEIIRNTPFLVQIFFIFFGLPSAGLRLSPNSAALLALIVNFGGLRHGDYSGGY